MTTYHFCDDNYIELHAQSTHKIDCKGKFPSPPVFDKIGKKIAFAVNTAVLIYDLTTGETTEIPKKAIKNGSESVRFDSNGDLYFVSGNSIVKHSFQQNKTDTLYTLKGAIHCPESLGISPDCRYVSFTKYGKGADRLYIIDTIHNACTDTEVSLYHYAWISAENIVFSKSGGLKIYDLTTQKTKVIIGSVASLFKKCINGSEEQLSYFRELRSNDFFNTSDLLRTDGNEIVFSLALDCFKGEKVSHTGIWKCDIHGKNLQFLYSFPSEYRKAVYKYFDNANRIAWIRDNSLRIYDGQSTEIYEGEHIYPVIEYDSKCK